MNEAIILENQTLKQEKPQSQDTVIVSEPPTPITSPVSTERQEYQVPNTIIDATIINIQLVINKLKKGGNEEIELDISNLDLSDYTKYHIFNGNKLIKDNEKNIKIGIALGACAGCIASPLLATTSLAISTGGATIGPSLYASVGVVSSLAGALVGGLSGFSTASSYGSNQKNYFDLKMKYADSVSVSLNNLYDLLKNRKIPLSEKEKICSLISPKLNVLTFRNHKMIQESANNFNSTTFGVGSLPVRTRNGLRNRNIQRGSFEMV